MKPLVSGFRSVANRFTRSHASYSRAGVIGQTLGHCLNLGESWVGQQIEVPYEQTVSSSEPTLWLAAFHHHDRIYTSVPFAQSIGLTSQVMPYSMMLFKTISMSHVDEHLDVLDLGYESAVYVRPGFAGDTFRQTFTIKHLRNTSGGKGTVVTVGCELHNQRNQLVFSVDKLMLYPKATPELRISQAPQQPPGKPRSPLLAHLLYHGETLPATNHLAALYRGQLILHSTAKPVGTASNLQLSTLFRWSHPSIYNLKRSDDLLVPGGLVLAAAIGDTSRSFYEILYEHVDNCSLINRASPTDLIGAISYIHAIKTLKEGFEEVTVTTLGLKNIDVPRELAGVNVPVELFTEKWRPHAMEQFLHSDCPLLDGKVVVLANRTLVRQSPYVQKRNIPLL